MNRGLLAVVIAGLLLAGCDDAPKKDSHTTSQPASKAPSMATEQVCHQVNAGSEVPAPLPMGLPFAIEQAVREYQLGYGRGDQTGLVGRIREQCRKAGVGL
jgi:hypothetical protein